MNRHLDRLLYGEGLLYDDVPITAGVGTSIATELIGGRNFQVVKLASGVASSATDVSPAAPLPIGPGLRTVEQCSRAAISVAAGGDNIIVAANVATKTRIYAMLLVAAAPVNVKIGESGVPTYYTGAMTFATASMLFLPQIGEPWFVNSAVNLATILNLSAAVLINGVIWYTTGP